MTHQVTVNTNIETEFLTQAKKHATTSHGLSMLALSMLDTNHLNLQMTLVFEDLDTLEDCAEQMTAVWSMCQSNKVLFRSAVQGGKFLTEYFGKQVSEVTSYPSASAEYKYFKVILDIVINDTTDTDTDTDTTRVYKFYRWNEPHPRVLIMKYEKNIENQQDK